MSGVKDALGDMPPGWGGYPNGPGHQRTSRTSKDAATSIRPHLGPLQTKIADFVKQRGTVGATYDEIVRGCEISAPTVCGRMVELVHAKILKKTTRTRRTASGRAAVIYMDAGIEE